MTSFCKFFCVCVASSLVLTPTSWAQETPTLGTEEALRAKYPDQKYVFTIRVDSPGYDYSSAEAWFKSAAKASTKGNENVVGHTWIQLSDGVSVICGGHSGECTGHADAPVRDARLRAPFLTYNEGLLALSRLDKNAKSPLPELTNSLGKLAADPRNPAAWLFFVYHDGHWAPGSAGHKRVTHEASWSITSDEYDAAVAYVRELTANNGELLRGFGLTQYQCTATAAAIATKANIHLDPFVEVVIPEAIQINGSTTRLRSDPIYSKIRFAAPEQMAKAITAVSAQKGGRRVVVRTK